MSRAGQRADVKVTAWPFPPGARNQGGISGRASGSLLALGHEPPAAAARPAH